jgi:hypothetical protein
MTILTPEPVISSFRPARVRVIGLAAAVLVLGILPTLAAVIPSGAHSGPGPTPMGGAMENAAVVLGFVLSWMFAERAARPGWRHGLAAALGLDLWAVLLGSFIVALQLSLASETSGDPLVGTIQLGLFGLILLGLPMLVLVFFPAIAWVGVVQLASRSLNGRFERPDTTTTHLTSS